MNFKKTYGRIKVYFHRAMAYASIINFVMVVFIFIKSYGLDVQKYSVLIVCATISFILFIGFLDDKLGLYKEEQRFHYSRVPQLRHIEKKLDKIINKE